MVAGTHIQLMVMLHRQRTSLEAEIMYQDEFFYLWYVTTKTVYVFTDIHTLHLNVRMIILLRIMKIIMGFIQFTYLLWQFHGIMKIQNMLNVFPNPKVMWWTYIQTAFICVGVIS